MGEVGDEGGDGRDGAGGGLAVDERAGERGAERRADHDAIGVTPEERGVGGGLDAEADA